jgi:hypothetical protein
MGQIVWIVIVIGILLLSAYAFFWWSVNSEGNNGPLIGPSRWSTPRKQANADPPAK